jgi:hypothetical protein
MPFLFGYLSHYIEIKRQSRNGSAYYKSIDLLVLHGRKISRT